MEKSLWSHILLVYRPIEALFTLTFPYVVENLSLAITAQQLA